jgi:uncharacterized membrane protein
MKKMSKTALEAVADVNPSKKGPLSGAKGVAAGVALAALAPAAGKGVARLAGPKLSELGDEARGKIDEITPDTSDLTPDLPDVGGLFGKSGDDSDDDDGSSSSAAPGYGSGRRMPIQQSVDVAVPINEAYDAWTRFEDWPRFMHRLEGVEQTDDATVAFTAKFWGIRRRFEAEIVEQRPDEKIEWDVSSGVAHVGLVTFHELGERLTRIELTVDIEPSGIIEKAGRGWRFAKRGIRGDLHRFKAFVELNEDEVKGWRGTIEDGEVKRKTERKASRSQSRSRGGNGSSGSRKKSSSSSNGSSRSKAKS